MTIMLYKTKQKALEHMRELDKYFKQLTHGYIVKIIYDRRDGPHAGMRGDSFSPKNDETYWMLCPMETKRRD